MEHRFYTELARFWPLISPVADYASEATYFLSILEHAAPPARDVLELGSGGGSNAFYFKARYAMTLTDLSAEMLAVSERLNPECEHVRGDMRTLRLGRLFDVVFAHDAIEYMASEADLRSALETAYVHCRPGGTFVVVPDSLRETFEAESDCGGTDAPDGRGARYLEWSWDPDPSDDWVQTEYSLITREADGTVHAMHESHRLGLFSESQWVEMLRDTGFEVRRLVEETDEDREPRTLFVCTRR